MEADATDGMAFCPEDAHGKPVIAVIYFVTFTVVSALVMLSLFIGAVTLGMQVRPTPTVPRDARWAHMHATLPLLIVSTCTPCCAPGAHLKTREMKRSCRSSCKVAVQVVVVFRIAVRPSGPSVTRCRRCGSTRRGWSCGRAGCLRCKLWGVVILVLWCARGTDFLWDGWPASELRYLP